MNKYNLLAFLESLPDARRGQGRRHSLSSFLVMIVFAIISGQQGLRGFVRFMKIHEEFFTSIFGLKHGVPSFGTTRTLLQSVSDQELSKSFCDWMKNYFPAEDEIWIAIDGKALCSTVQDPFGKGQNFASIVSAFAQRSGLVYAQALFNTGKSYEPRQVRQLIDQLQLNDVIFSLDAIHCQKKRLT